MPNLTLHLNQKRGFKLTLTFPPLTEMANHSLDIWSSNSGIQCNFRAAYRTIISPCPWIYILMPFSLKVRIILLAS